MITESQRKWLEHLNDDDKIVIFPYDPNSEIIFESVRGRVLNCLGNNFDVLHRGASHLKISGQDEIDIYVPVRPDIFDSTVTAMQKSFGAPGSLYPLVRARFRMVGYSKHIDIFIINKEDAGWTDSELFTNFLLVHPEVLDEYRKLKESGNGLSTKAYYSRKIEFINEILEKAKH